MIKLYLIGALVLAVVAGGGGLWIRALKAENKLLENAYGIAAQVAIDNKATLDAERLEATRVSTILVARDRQRRDAEKRNEVLNGLLDNLKRADQVVRDWSDTAVPDAVRGLLNRPEGPGQDRDPETTPAADPDPAHRPAGQ